MVRDDNDDDDDEDDDDDKMYQGRYYFREGIQRWIN